MGDVALSQTSVPRKPWREVPVERPRLEGLAGGSGPLASKGKEGKLGGNGQSVKRWPREPSVLTPKEGGAHRRPPAGGHLSLCHCWLGFLFFETRKCANRSCTAKGRRFSLTALVKTAALKGSESHTGL